MIEVRVEDPAWRRSVPRVAALARQAAVLAGERHSFTILLAGDAAVSELNGRFRGKPGPTNVLSFPAADRQTYLGDIALAFGVCSAEAHEQGKALGDHLRHLVIHGVLHLLGYDHEAEDEARAMEQMERALLTKLGVADPYDPLARGIGEHDHPQP